MCVLFRVEKASRERTVIIITTRRTDTTTRQGVWLIFTWQHFPDRAVTLDDNFTLYIYIIYNPFLLFSAR